MLRATKDLSIHHTHAPINGVRYVSRVRYLLMPSSAFFESISVSISWNEDEASLGSWKDTSAPTLLSRVASFTWERTRRLIGFTPCSCADDDEDDDGQGQDPAGCSHG